MIIENELQVYFGKELVGHLKVDGKRYADRDHIVLETAENLDLSRPSSELYLETAVRKWSIDDLRVAKIGESGVIYEAKKANVPAYAMKLRNPLTFSRDYHWRVVKIHEDHFDRYETLFDLDIFEPIDAGELCPERPSLRITDYHTGGFVSGPLRFDVGTAMMRPETIAAVTSTPRRNGKSRILEDYARALGVEIEGKNEKLKDYLDNEMARMFREAFSR